jgi:hypothetical protein
MLMTNVTASDDRNMVGINGALYEKLKPLTALNGWR